MHMTKCEITRRKRKKNWMAVLMCVLAFTATVPSVTAYAGTKSHRSAHTRKRSDRVSDESKMRDTAGKVQKAFDEKDLDELVSLCGYPVTFVDQNGKSREIGNKKELRSLGKDAIFTKDLTDAVGAANTAKAKAENGKTLKIGSDAGVTMKKSGGKWKISRIQVKNTAAAVSGGTAAAGSNLVQAAEQFQRTFYYRDLETLSKQCSYPVKIYLSDGSIQDIPSAEKLMALGESKVFTDDLVAGVNEVNAAGLKEVDQKVQVGAICGFWMTKKNGEWKIDTIVQ